MLAAIGHSFRLLRTARVLARHDALFFLEDAGIAPMAVGLLKRVSGVRAEGRPGERLARALMALGPSFIKLGQSLAVRSDLIGDSVAADLSTLQAHMPPFPATEAIATIERALGGPLDSFFTDFEEMPVAAASIAQVHFAHTVEGEAVAVKVLRPGIEAAFAHDLKFLLWIARMLELFAPAARRLRPVAVVEAFRGWADDELDLRMEAAAASELAENFAGDSGFHVPKVDWARSARRVLTMERVEGVPIADIEQLAEAGLDSKAVLEQAAAVFFRQVFEHGFFHADMHPGNMFIGQDGTLLPVDFGIMGRLDRRTRHYLADMLLGFLTGDYRRVADVHFDAGYVPREQSRAAFTQACRAIGEPIIGRPTTEISLARLLAQLFEVTERFRMETQPQLLLLQKTMLVAEGVGRRLDPDTNMWVVTQPLIEAWMVENRGPQAQLRDAAERMAETARRMPEIVDGLAAMAGADGLRLHPDTVAAMKAPAKGTARLAWPWLVAAVLGGVVIGLLI